jgi:hypothetical protein
MDLQAGVEEIKSQKSLRWHVGKKPSEKSQLTSYNIKVKGK